MQRVSSLCFVCVLALACGCQNVKPVGRTYHDALSDSRQAIVRGQTIVASGHLVEARSLAKSEGASSVEADLLNAEAKLREHKPAPAMILARDVLSKEPSNPRGHEVLGKAILASGGPFADAEQAFNTALRGYEDPQDQRRVEDLIALTRGLTAYGKGDPDVAARYFKQITDPQLRFTVDKAAREAADQGLARR